MFEKNNARKLMKALYIVFIYVRSNPENPIHKDIILIFQRHLTKDLRSNKLKMIIMDLEKHIGNDYINYLIKALKKFEFKLGKYTISRINESIPVLKEILNNLVINIENKEFNKVRIMASAVHNYPDFLICEYRCSSEQFWEEHIKYYNRIFEEDFLNDWEYLFREFYKNN